MPPDRAERRKVYVVGREINGNKNDTELIMVCGRRQTAEDACKDKNYYYGVAYLDEIIEDGPWYESVRFPKKIREAVGV